MFMLDVRREGDLGGIEAFLTWDQPRFFELMTMVEPDDRENRPDDEEDLRIVTVLSCGVTDLHLEDLLAKNVRIEHYSLMNPANKELLRARHGLRTDTKTPDKGRIEIEEQLDQLIGIMSEYPKLKVRVSDAMPSGFITHSKELGTQWDVSGSLFVCQRAND